MIRRLIALCMLMGAVDPRLHAAEPGMNDPLIRVALKDSKSAGRTIEGRIVTEAQDGGLLLQSRDGALWTVTPEQLQSREATGASFEPLTKEELGQQLLAELGDGFEIVTTRNYVICTSAGTAYGRWCGSLFERLMGALQSHWRALELHEPEFPLVAIVFRDPGEFAKFTARDVGAAAADSKGYYSVRSNRIVLYDLTAGSGAERPRSVEELNERLATSAFNVATVVHEATHQVAFNIGLHTRYADNPLWLTEGMAMYFETPDLRSRTGWRTIGRVNPSRLRQFREYARTRRGPESLQTLLGSDARFTDPETAADAYAEAWALTYFLIKARREQYLRYLEHVRQKRPLFWSSEDQRLREFTEIFGDPATLDEQFLRYMQRAR